MLTRYENTRTFIMTSTVLGLGFLLAGLAHTAGFLTLAGLDNDSRVYAADGVELLCGVLLLGAAFALRGVRASGWRNALGAHVIALVCLTLGVLLFSDTLRLSPLAFGFNLVMLALLVFNTLALWRMRPRNPLKRAQHEIAARLY
jgi:hypothetical protein